MKKLFIIGVLPLFFFACRKDSSGNSSPIFGKWYYVADTLKTTDGKGNVLSEDDSGGGMTFDGSFWTQFNSNATGVVQDGDANYQVHFTYLFSGASLTLTVPSQSIKDNNNSVISIPPSVTQATVKKLTGDSMEIYTDAIDSDGDHDIEFAYYSKTKP